MGTIKPFNLNSPEYVRKNVVADVLSFQRNEQKKEEEVNNNAEKANTHRE